MAKLTFLQMTNRVLRRLSRADVTDVTALTGQAQIAADAINEAQKALFAESTNWYSLYKTRIFTTAKIAATTISFADADPDTISDSGSALVTSGFEAGMEIHVTGSTSNDGTYSIASGGVAAGVLTLQTADKLTTEAAGDSVVVTAYTHPVPSDFGRTIDITNITDNLTLIEGYGRSFDEFDPNMDSTSTITEFVVQGDNYRFAPIPSGATKLRERYWAIPTALSANTDTSDLPVEYENCLIQWAWAEVLRYVNSFDKADRVEAKFNRMLALAKIANDKRLDKMKVLQPNSNRNSLRVPRLPVAYGYRGGFY